MSEILDEQEDAPTRKGRGPSCAVISGTKLDALLRTEDGKPASQSRSYKQEAVPGFSGDAVSCEWRVGVDSAGEPNTAEIELRRGSAIIGEMKVRRETSADGEQVWNVWHRFVVEGERGAGIGTYALKTVESFIGGLNFAKPPGVKTIEFQISQPSVIDFALSKGYAFKGLNAEDKRSDYDRFKTQTKEHEKDPAFTKRGELPGFIIAKLATEDGKSKDMVLIDREKLAAYAKERGRSVEDYLDTDYAIDPRTGEETEEIASEFKRLSATWEELSGSEEQRLPFIYRAGLRKTLMP